MSSLITTDRLVALPSNWTAAMHLIYTTETNDRQSIEAVDRSISDEPDQSQLLYPRSPCPSCPCIAAVRRIVSQGPSRGVESPDHPTSGVGSVARRWWLCLPLTQPATAGRDRALPRPCPPAQAIARRRHERRCWRGGGPSARAAAGTPRPRPVPRRRSVARACSHAAPPAPSG